MTAAEFSAWIDLMRGLKGWSKFRCSRELGCHKDCMNTWRDRGAPFYIGLACHALAYGLGPWKPAQKETANG